MPPKCTENDGKSRPEEYWLEAIVHTYGEATRTSSAKEASDFGGKENVICEF